MLSDVKLFVNDDSWGLKICDLNKSPKARWNLHFPEDRCPEKYISGWRHSLIGNPYKISKALF